MFYEELLEMENLQPRRRSKDRRRVERARLDWRDLDDYEALNVYPAKRGRRERPVELDDLADDRPRRREAKPWRRRERQEV